MNQNNKLNNENSPYLLQHKDNPVNWYPWGKEAFTKAKKEEKPVFLSIGYSTCHWCHVMARESFEDREVALLLNRVFIPVKVDREERPEIDNIYMNVCQLMTGSGGWPLTIFLKPDKKPFFAATYIPKYNKSGRTGLIELIKKTEKLWKDNREEIINSAGTITRELKRKESISTETPVRKDLDEAYYELENTYDSKYGGFGYTTKFPTTHRLIFLLHYWYRTKNDRALKMVEVTLQNIRKGGICDQLGLGFHRYTMDREWRIPHFEKMLYDQALLSYTFSELYQVTKIKKYNKVVKEIFEYIKEKLYSSEFAFYAAEDAESEGEEGKYYLWKENEIKDLMTDKDILEFNNIFTLNNINNFTHQDVDKYTLSLTDIKYIDSDKYNNIKNKLLEYRNKRTFPMIDKKILTDWNGLVIAALAKSAWVFNNENYLKTARKAYKFINDNLINNNKLYHSYYRGKVSVKGNIDDYSFLILGLIELYQATFNYNYIKKAVKLQEYTNLNYWDDKKGGFYFSAQNKKELITRQKEYYDGAVPSGNSISFWNLIRLAHITGNIEYEDRAEKLALSFMSIAKQAPSNYSQFYSSVDCYLGPFIDVIIVGHRDNKLTKEMFKALRENYIPNKVILFKNKDDSDNIGEERFKEYTMVNNKTTAYVCKNYTCKLPTNNVKEMLAKIKE